MLLLLTTGGYPDAMAQKESTQFRDITYLMEGNVVNLGKEKVWRIVPSSGSGVTISTGLDLSQTSPEKLAQIGISDDNIKALKAVGAFGKDVTGAKAKAVAKKLMNSNFTVSKAEQAKISEYLNKEAAPRRENIKAEMPNVSSKAQAVLLQAYHWAGKGYRNVGKSTMKFTIKDDNGKLINPLSDLAASKGKDVTDDDIKSVLKQYETYWKGRGWKANAGTFTRYLKYMK